MISHAEPQADLAIAAEAALARAAQPAWAAIPLSSRLAVVRRTRHLLAAHAGELEELIRAARQSLPADPVPGEIVSVADACRFLEREAGRILRPRHVGVWGRPLWLAGVYSEVRREPFGLVLVIGPSNYPLFLPGVHSIQALVAGNAVLVKPAPGTGAIMARLADLTVEAGLDPRLLRVLPEDPEAGRQALGVGVDKVVLTGSARTGAAVLAELAPRLVPSTMELSGCDAAFIRSDADLDRVTRALSFGLWFNRSETCIAPRRVFVPEALAPELEKRLTAVAGEQLAMERRTRPAAAAALLVEDAIHRGARLIAGSILPDRQGITPAILSGASPEMPLLQEDVFAPVISLVAVRDDEDALQAAARCPYALGATVFGEEAGARAFAERVRAGGVVINDLIVPTADPRLPFGGLGKSGFGVTRGPEGLLEMTTIKVVTVRRGKFLLHLDPPDPSDVDFYRDYLLAAHSASWKKRMGAWFRVIPALIRKSRRVDTPRKESNPI